VIGQISGGSINSRLFLSPRFYCVLVVYFVGIAAVAAILTFAFSVSSCLWNPHVACFSISRYGAAFLIEVVRMWTLLAFVAALVTAIATQVQKNERWWHIFILMFASIIVTGLCVEILGIGYFGSLAREALHDLVAFFVAFIVLLVASFGCRFAANRICKAIA
jgi:hypothetical protein